MIFYKYYRYLIFLAFLLLHSFLGKTENQPSLYYHYTMEDGLSFNSVNQIEQDYQGFLWFSTDNGLSKFDGYSFTVYFRKSGENTLSDNRIIRTFEDSDSVLWVCTSRGLNIYNRKKDNFIHVPLPGVNTDKGESVIEDVLEDKPGSIWILTISDLIHYDKVKDRYRNMNVPIEFPSDQFTKLFLDSDSTLWIGITNKGVMIYNILTGNVSFKYGDKFQAGVKQFLKNSDGDRYIAANEGILLISGKDKSSAWHPYLPSQPTSQSFEVWDMMIGRDGDIWLATDNSGIKIANNDLKITATISNQPGDPYSLASNITRSIFEDRDHNIWVGTLNNGVLFIPDLRTSYFTSYIPTCKQTNGECIKTTTAVYETRTGDVWLGSDGAGLYRYSPQTGSYKNYQSVQGDNTSLSANAILDIQHCCWPHLMEVLENLISRTDILKGYRCTI